MKQKDINVGGEPTSFTQLITKTDKEAERKNTSLLRKKKQIIIQHSKKATRQQGCVVNRNDLLDITTSTHLCPSLLDSFPRL